jgi:hypothetical protein
MESIKIKLSQKELLKKAQPKLEKKNKVKLVKKVLPKDKLVKKEKQKQKQKQKQVNKQTVRITLPNEKPQQMLSIPQPSITIAQPMTQPAPNIQIDYDRINNSLRGLDQSLRQEMQQLSGRLATFEEMNQQKQQDIEEEIKSQPDSTNSRKEHQTTMAMSDARSRISTIPSTTPASSLRQPNFETPMTAFADEFSGLNIYDSLQREEEEEETETPASSQKKKRGRKSKAEKVLQAIQAKNEREKLKELFSAEDEFLDDIYDGYKKSKLQGKIENPEEYFEFVEKNVPTPKTPHPRGKNKNTPRDKR